ncbi:MAG: DUF2325 domain-containing protein [Spirochaetaceae bacterium]|jgi:hypothetical protein|nr:DUF2325 domain-containing protein [Spirochaetaceae bacterium]
MSVTIIGGHDRMHCRYKEICKEYGWKAKVFTQPRGDMDCSIGCSDLIILFTDAVSHSVVKLAKKTAARRNISLAQSHCGSCQALRTILAGQGGKAQGQM